MAQRSWQSILVAVRDPAQRQQPGIRKAAHLAASTGARLTLFHAFATPWPLPTPLPVDARGILQAATASRRAGLERLARPLRDAGIDVACDVAWDFPPPDAVVRRVLVEKPDLLVAESHRHSQVARWFLANADWELIRECPCPVWFVKSLRVARRPSVVVGVDPTHARAKPSRLDDRLLAAAASVTHLLQGRLTLVHADDDALRQSMLRLAGSTSAASVPPPSADVAGTIERLARRHGATSAATVVRAGTAVDVLQAVVAETSADLLVLGALSRSGLERFFIGNTAETVIDAVNCDLLVVKAPGFRSRVSRRAPHLPVGTRKPSARG